ncbi:hypothetical protein [Chryseobacterium sp.]|uniref:hypothetical protein n=1 Tax=Chryseobacterium sp. TaxID=1871047 RepID=UPI0012A9D6ED|nr:hypothetical protein [Chryseobacterium sp.]QFG53676.1 hypothetical protein F7R58_08955 [Chryseobacterium sp.]
MENILNRIKQVAEYENVTITFLEAKIGASKGVLSRAIKNNTDIQAKWLTKIVENYPRLNSCWLLTGKGEMLNDRKSEALQDAASTNLHALGTRFSEFLLHKGLSEKKAGNLLGETDSQISNIINGHNFGCDKMYNILNVFKDLDANFLFRGSNPMIIGNSGNIDYQSNATHTISESLLNAQQELLKYKDTEIKNLRKEISELKKDYKQGIPYTRVAEERTKLK